MRPTHASVAILALSLSAPLLAQVPPGQSVATIANGSGTTSTGEMVYIDHAGRKTTKLTLPPALTTVPVNCITMVNPVLGYTATAGRAGVVTKVTPSDIYRITLGGTKVMAVKLNTKPLGGYNCAQIAVAAGKLYFTTADANWTSGTTKGYYDGFLYSMPANGGAPTVLVTLKSLSGWATNSTPNALCSDGVLKVWFAVWPNGQLWEYDTAKKTTTLLMTLPNTKLNGSSPFYPVNMHTKKSTSALSRTIYVGGLYGDIAEIDVANKKVLGHWYAKTPTLSGGTTTKNSFYPDTDAGDFILGTRDGHADILVPSGAGQASHRDVAGVGSNTTLTLNSVNGIWHNAMGAYYRPFGAGCNGTGSYKPTSVSGGGAKAGNKNFAFSIGDCVGSGVGILFLGSSKLALDLTAAGAPGCILRQNLLFAFPAVLKGSGPGTGKASLPLPLPLLKATLPTQWVILDKTANTLGLALSDGRELRL